MKLVLASRNKHKINEIEAFLKSSGFNDVTLLSLDDIGYDGDITEDGGTFEENAVIKASAPASLGYYGIADDSGLEVDCLDGRPGVYSARFAGESCDDLRNNEKLLSELASVPPEKRTAKFVSVIAFISPDNESDNFTVRGECPGIMIDEYRGNDGFGYDPLFCYPPLGKTYAEMTAAEKNSISHRGRAMRLFVEKFGELLRK